MAQLDINVHVHKIPSRKNPTQNEENRFPLQFPPFQDANISYTRICSSAGNASHRFGAQNFLGRFSSGCHASKNFQTAELFLYTGSKPFHSSSFHLDPDNEWLSKDTTAKDISLTNATKLFSIPEGVEIYYIKQDGTVHVPVTNSSLHIVKFKGPELRHGSHNELPPAFLHVGYWVYPLIPEVSPVLLTTYGAYIFPDLLAKENGSAVAVVMPDTLSENERQRFESIVKAYTLFENEEIPKFQGEITEAHLMVGKRTGGYIRYGMSLISRGISLVSELVSWTISKIVELVSKVIRVGSTKAREQIKPALKTYPIDPKIQKGIVYAKQATTAAVKVTGYVVQKLEDAAVDLAATVSPKVREQAAKIIPEAAKKDSIPKAAFDGMVDVAASSVKGLAAVYTRLKNASNTLRKSLSEETVNIVQHKFGKEAGAVTEDTLNTAKNVSDTMLHTKSVEIKSLAKKASTTTRNKILINHASEKDQSKSPEWERPLKSQKKDKPGTQ